MIGALELPRLEPACRLTVCIPARDEQDRIAATLEAFTHQSDPTAFEVVVLANNCSDATAERIRGFARAHPRLHLHACETTFPGDAAHVGAARKLMMDHAAQRYLAAGRPRGILAGTDADTIVAPDWVAQMLSAMSDVDAVAGDVWIGAAERDAMPAPVRELYEHEMEYRRLCTELESLIDPRPEDPPPRHGAFVGANFGVTAAMYVRAGAMPSIACLEDREFCFALRRVDARIRHSLAVRAQTSGRRNARVSGGFSTFIDHLHRQGNAARSYLVAHPQETIDELETRAALRRLWEDTRTPLATIDRRVPFGSAYAQVVSRADAIDLRLTMIPVDEAIETLRRAVAARRVRRAANLPLG